jgi:chromosome segregation ATPase
MTQITRRDLEQLLVELAPLPEIVARMSDDITAMRRERAADRESLIRLEECLRQVAARVEKLNGAVDRALQEAADARANLARNEERIDALSKLVWGIAVPTILMMVKTAVDLFVG